MGCINSKRKEPENFRIRAVEIQAATQGYLELTPRELYFYSNHGQQTVWQLQHLRRYGINADVFSFEAGRRCMSGPGISTFRCQQADSFYQLFQRYVNQAAATDDPFLYADREHPSHTLGRGAVDALTGANTNNYLEPAPLAAGSSTFRTTMMRDSFSSSPLSLDLDSSPDSVPSLSFTNEVVHFQSQQALAATRNSGAYGNVYLEQPFRLPPTNTESNNNTNSASGLTKRTKADAPPEECAPILSPALADKEAAMHMYANINVDNLNTTLRGYKTCSMALLRPERDKSAAADSERCYENLSRADLPPLMLPSGNSATALGGYTSEVRTGEPGTPGTSTASATIAIANAVNYIVLDLDQPRSPTQTSPKTCFGSGLSLTADYTEQQHPPTVTAITNQCSIQLPTPMLSTSATTTNMDESVHYTAQSASSQQQATSTTESYSTIDFIKTCALIKASGGAGDTETDHEESRITRHSHNKCMRKAYSISE